MRRDKACLKKALREAGASAWHQRAAAILLAVNGIESALAYVADLEALVTPTRDLEHGQDFVTKPPPH